MPDPGNLVKAQFQELDSDYTDVLSGSSPVPVQFNPETLKVSFANQLVEPKSGGDKRGQPARQFVGAGTIKLSLQLWFDITAPPYSDQGLTDVQQLTQAIAYFITPKVATPSGGGSSTGSAGGSSGGGSSGTGSGGGSGAGSTGGAQDQTQFQPPCVRFVWGAFRFDGMMDSLDESLEFFSPDGYPLRANLSVAMSRQKITPFFNPSKATRAPAGGSGGPGGAPPGTTPLTSAAAGASLPQIAASAGLGASWQSIAAANGIEQPRNLAAGALVNLGARATLGAGGTGPSAGAGSRSAQAHHWEVEMPVVINDFEVVTPSGQEQPEAKGGGGAPPASDSEQILKTVHEDLRTRREREERLYAT